MTSDDLIDGARRLPAAHISVRIPWNDTGWEGCVCENPRANNSCLALKRIGETRDDEKETALASSSWDKLSPSQLPVCATERGAFMAPFEHIRKVVHPYQKTNDQYRHFKETTFVHPPYSAGCIPYAWMLKKKMIGDGKKEEGLAPRLKLDYQPDREPTFSSNFDPNWIQDYRNQLVALDTFFSAIREEDSLCIFYAKRTPLSEDSRRVIVGIGRVLRVGDWVEYEYEDGDRPVRCVLWDRNVHHSIRPNFKDGFILPYHEFLKVTENDPEIDMTEFIAFAPDDHWESFSYASEHVSHDAAIAALLACAKIIPKIAKHVSGEWEGSRKWIDRQLNRLWKARGPYPGLGSALYAFGLEHGNLLAYEITSLIEEKGGQWSEDPWKVFEAALDDPALLGPGTTDYVGPTYKKAWMSLPGERKALLKLLSRFELSSGQATRFYQPTERDKAGIDVSDQSLLENPYLLFEADRGQPDPVFLGVIDRGVFPDSIVREIHPLQEPSRVDEPVDRRRARAFVVDELEKASLMSGHTVQPKDWVIQAIRDREVRPECPLSVDILSAVEAFFPPTVETVEIAGGDTAFQIDRLVNTRNIIKSAVSRRTKGIRHTSGHDWRELLDEELGNIENIEDQEQEERAREEKAAALRELFESRIGVLVGPAGTGKTTLLKVLCKLSDISNGGVLLLAPTGKARVRLEQQTGLSGGKTIAQFLNGLDRYDNRTGRYLVTGSPDKEDGYKTVFIDESSMMTEEQLAATLDAIKGVERLILVGDSRQLPPIGSGRPFLDIVRHLEPDLIESIFPKTGAGFAELTIRRRQVGENRDDLLLADWFSGKVPDAGADEIWTKLERGEASGNIDLVGWNTPEELEKKLLAKLAEELGLEGPDDENGFEQSLGGILFKDAVYFNAGRGERIGPGASAENWQILSPVRSNLPGVDSLNRIIQKSFRKRAYEFSQNREARRQDGSTYTRYRKAVKPLGKQRILYGDKVINTVNQHRYNTYPKKKNAYVANGEIGIAVGQYKGRNAKYKGLPWKLEIEYSTQPGLTYDYFKSDFSEEGNDTLELAYALTVHKTQGSEFGTTFVVLPNPCFLLTRELLYTALTRQVDKIVIFHQGGVRELRKFGDPFRSDMARRLTNIFDVPKPVELNGRFMEDSLIHKTTRGDAVRSKSEVIIANLLHGMDIDYEYEREVISPDGSRRFPDFTIEDDETGATVYIEHLGLLHDPVYRTRWDVKLEWYRNMGILPEEEGGGENGTLVTTRDDKGGGIDSNEIETVIKRVLGR